MKKYFLVSVALLFLINSTGFCLAADDWSSVPLAATPLPLLGGRVLINMPTGARIEQRVDNIMSAEPSVEKKTRVVFEKGDKKFVIMAYDTFQTAEDDFMAREKKKAEKANSPAEEIISNSNFQVLQINEVPFTVPDDVARGVARVYIISADKTVQVLYAYANAEAAKDVNGVQAFYARVLKTLMPGGRQLNIKARTALSDRLAVDLPDGFVHTTDIGPDFSVDTFTKVVPYESSRATIGIYVGGHPEPVKDGEAVPGVLLGENVKWTKRSLPNQLTMEAIIPIPGDKTGCCVHVFFNAPTQKELDDVQGIVNTLRWAKGSRQ